MISLQQSALPNGITFQVSDYFETPYSNNIVQKGYNFLRFTLASHLELSPKIVEQYNYADVNSSSTMMTSNTQSTQNISSISEVIQQESEGNIQLELHNLFINLLNKQEPLGAEFEKIIDDNIWDLYVS